MDNQDFFLHNISLRKLNSGNAGLLNTGCFIASLAIEMDMIVVVVGMLAGRTDSIFGLKLIVRDPV